MSTEKKRIFKGAATALVTPFADGEIDYSSLAGLIERQIAAGIDALVICGTTGEASTLTDAEQRSVIEFAVEKTNGRVPIAAGAGSNDTSHMLKLSRDACAAGADALLLITPYYNKASSLGLEKSFLQVADAVDRPIILYNIPSRTGVDIPIPVFRRLAEHENIVAVKEASGNISKIARLAAETRGKLDLYSGNDDQIMPIMSLGGIGVISVLSNIMPAEVKKICALYESGNVNEACELQLNIMRITDALFSSVNPIPVKTALSVMDMCREEFRLPMCELEEAEKLSLIRILNSYGLI